MLFPSDASDLLSRIPLSARTILDVGCGSGALVAAYRPLNPRARLLGIDIDPVQTALATPHLHQVATMDVETDPLPFDVPDGIDCIIYDDILEHLRDPWAMLHRHAEALSSDGVMLICVPNIDYWRLAERLLRGTWHDSQDQDPHHRQLRWFNLDSMRENLIHAGLTLCDVTTREPDGDQAAQFAASLAPGLEAMDIDPQEYARRAAPSHLIWRVRKEPRQRMILAGTMLAPVGGVSDVRVVYPMEAIGTDPMVTAGVVERVEFGQGGDGNARIFVLHRPSLIGEQGHTLLQGLAQAGFLVVTEFDDLPERFAMMRMGGDLGFYGVHAVQTSTLAMAEALRRYNPEIAVFPNAVGALPAVRNFADPRSITLFFGALNREHDWLPFMPAINAVAQMAGDRLKFQVVHDQSFFDALESPHKTFTPTCDYETYLDILGRSEISFMPLSDTPFNRAKSDLKFIEAASCRVATLASTVVYSNTVEDGRNGLLFRDPVQFQAGLLRLLAMPEMAREMADTARRYVIDNRMLAYQVAPRIAWYRSLWARRDALNLARHERMQRNRIAA
ncbi:methyltransferase domain-containing protein [Acidisphaera sp. S103]|uniref:methyltransferase domain-containing protein n=1 Tax=Acidisphaera sp. S103 TaxID=1747223 RepID=UPI00131B544C|nr:methyltransferase domain-containing protein [Acidisphaera sp. S103]